MRLKPISFRTKIVVTLIVVTSVFSFISFQIYSHYLSQRIYKYTEDNVKNILYFLRDEIINIHDGRLIKPLLTNLGKDQRIFRTYLLDGDGKIVFSNKEDDMPFDTTDFYEFIHSEDDIHVKTYRSIKNPVARAFLHVRNTPACYQCHSPDKETLGYVVFDLSLSQTRSNLVFTRNFSILFTVCMVLIILCFVLIMHYRFVRKSLSRFQDTIQGINSGEMDMRVAIKESSELGELGSSFNRMLDNFQHAQDQLASYHQKEMETAEKLANIGEMAARLAHDVRNPLTGIANSIEIIANDMNDSPHKPILEEIKRQATRVNVAISNLLKYSHSIEIRKTTGNIIELINSLVLFLQSQRQNEKVDIVCQATGTIPPFEFDREQIENVLMNLCFNAMQAMQFEGKVIISLEMSEGGKGIIISIKDNGPGIPLEMENDIFKPFFTTRTEGTGLGLAIAKDIVEKHGGKIWFYNQPGEGVTFYLSLPFEE